MLREVAGYFNTVLGPPAAFPRRVLYRCTLPGHKTGACRRTNPMDVKKPLLSAGGWPPSKRCVEHLGAMINQNSSLSTNLVKIYEICRRRQIRENLREATICRFCPAFPSKRKSTNMERSPPRQSRHSGGFPRLFIVPPQQSQIGIWVVDAPFHTSL